VLIGYAYQSYLWAQGRQRARGMGWTPDAERRFAAMIEEWQADRRRDDSLLLANRTRLGVLSYAANPDSAELESLIYQRGEMERDQARREFDFGRRLNELRPPEKRRQMEKSYRRMMGLPSNDSAAAGDSGRGRN
jgi:hypothetical protein